MLNFYSHCLFFNLEILGQEFQREEGDINLGSKNENLSSDF